MIRNTEQKTMQEEIDSIAPEVDSVEKTQEKYSEVQNVAREHGVFIVHKILPGYVEVDDEATPLKEGPRNIKLLATNIIAASPEISCSSIEKDDTEQNFYKDSYGVGVLVNGGNIVFAAASDAFTEFDEKGEKTQVPNVDTLYQSSENYQYMPPHIKRRFGGPVKSKEDIDFAIQARRKSRSENYRTPLTLFNELSIEDPKTVGFFKVLMDRDLHYSSGIQTNEYEAYVRQTNQENRSVLVDVGEADDITLVSELASYFDIPYYVFYKGKFYSVDHLESNPEDTEFMTHRLFFGEELTIEEYLALQSPLEKDPARRSEMIKDLYNAKLFKGSGAVKRLARKKST